MTRLFRQAGRAARGVQARLFGRLAGSVVSVDVDLPWVALTFDDGPHPATTPRFLDVLGRYQARATFFMVGSQALRYPQLVQAVAAAGHAIGHHTLDHVSLPGLDRAARRRQLAGGFEAVGPSCARLFRAPYGHLDFATWRAARRDGHEVVAWSNHVSDWTAQSATTLTARLRESLAPGAIVLLHDAPQPNDPPAEIPRSALLEALDRMLSEVHDGWRFVTVPEMLAAGRPRRRVRWRAADR